VSDTPRDPQSTVAQAYEYWLENRRDEVKKNTWKGYRQYSVYIVGPLLVGTRTERVRFSRRGVKRADAQFVEMLGSVPIAELTTARIRAWHKTLQVLVSSHTANVAKKFLRAALALAAEDQRVLSVPHMPTRLGRGTPRPRKSILSPEQVGVLLTHARQDKPNAKGMRLVTDAQLSAIRRALMALYKRGKVSRYGYDSDHRRQWGLGDGTSRESDRASARRIGRFSASTMHRARRAHRKRLVNKRR